EVVDRALAVAVPPRRRLLFALPEEGIAGVGVAKPDHVAGELLRASASWSTAIASLPSGCHAAPCRRSPGARLPSWVRGRANQRRMPNSLYPPARWDTILARWCTRPATSSGAARSP